MWSKVILPDLQIIGHHILMMKHLEKYEQMTLDSFYINIIHDISYESSSNWPLWTGFTHKPQTILTFGITKKNCNFLHFSLAKKIPKRTFKNSFKSIAFDSITKYKNLLQYCGVLKLKIQLYFTNFSIFMHLAIATLFL